MDTVLFLEDDERSIDAEVAIVERLGLQSCVKAKPFMFANYLDGSEGRDVVAGVLDMHNPDIKNLNEISKPAVQTENGEVVGLAVAESFLRGPEGEHQSLPVSFLTGYKVQQKVRSRIKALAHNSDDALIFKKGRNEAEFERFLRAAVARRRRERQDDAPVYEEMVHIARLMIEDLIEDPDIRMSALGFLPNRRLLLDDAESLMRSVPSIDTRDRNILIIEMKSRLDAIFQREIESQREWLMLPQAHLNGASPLDLLRSGRQHQLAEIVGLLKLVTG